MALRQEYRCVPFARFTEIVFEIGRDVVSRGGSEEDWNVLRALLEEAKAESLKERRAEEQKVAEQIEKITASMLHRKLKLNLPDDVDPEHIQAILVYGFIAPSSSKRFVGSRFLPGEHILKDVFNKLGPKFNAVEYRVAFSFLVNHGVIRERSRRTTVYSMSVNEGSSELTDWGIQIVRSCKQFMHEQHNHNK